MCGTLLTTTLTKMAGGTSGTVVRRVAWTFAAALLAGLLLLSSRAGAELIELSGATMGTTYQVKLVAADGAAIDAHELQAEIQALLEEVNDQMSTYRPESELSRFNRAPPGQWFMVSRATAEVVAAALTIGRQSQGALDVTVGPVVRLWHFGPAASSDIVGASQGTAGPRAAQFAPPSPEAISAALQRTGAARLDARLDPPALRKEIDGLEIDLSAIAKGYAVDCMAELIAERGSADYLVSIGGEIRAAGKRLDGTAWRVAVERPDFQRRERQMVLPLMDRAISTAGDYRNFFEHNGRRYSHVIDPSTGRPIEHRLSSVTVVAERTITADGWSTALSVLGPERGMAVAEKHGIAALFLSHSDDEDSPRMTSHWEAHLDPRPGP